MIKGSARYSDRLYVALAFLAVLAWVAVQPLRAVQEAQSQDQGQTQSQDQTQTQTKEQPKKKGGFFKGLSKVGGGQSGQESSATASAGAKGAGEGKAIANLTPSAADIAAVTGMEHYNVTTEVLKKFEQDGHLQPKQ
jgi:hypothetical protein